ncbi:MAG: hypothetical protein ACI35P_16460 [Bacillus sp. (in: firmicutes)]
MKVIRRFLVTLVVLAGLGYGVYYIGTNIASEKIMDAISAELENSGEWDAIENAIANDSALQAFLEEGANIDESKLPFTTKEEATRVIINKIGVSELQNIVSEVQAGTMSKSELMAIAESNLTEDEIQALKVIAYKEYAQ